MARATDDEILAALETTRSIALEGALRALVTLKDGPRGTTYDTLKPLAWEYARRVLAIVDGLTSSTAPVDAAQVVEPIDAGYWQSQAISARARGDARVERWALDQLALIERSR